MVCDVITANLFLILAGISRRFFFKTGKRKDPPPHYEERSGPPTQTRGDQQLQGHHAQTSIDPGYW